MRQSLDKFLCHVHELRDGVFFSECWHTTSGTSVYLEVPESQCPDLVEGHSFWLETFDNGDDEASVEFTPIPPRILTLEEHQKIIREIELALDGADLDGDY